ncbi:MAG: prenyltransferase/squalene oxidase repeat-containing protein [Henriciella sp.]|nr:prenyltransferase/squalene oxidase repeat-containing protein [Henriciella sp.]
MDDFRSSCVMPHLLAYSAAARRILDIQGVSGAIPWFEDGPWDSWNHVESAMALTTMGERDAAEAAYRYLRRLQRPDGAWFGDYGNALPMVDRDYISRTPAPQMLDTNFCAYPAVGIAHHYLHTDDRDWLRQHWSMIKSAIDFVLSLQRSDGTVSWAYEALGTDEDDALLAGNASIAKSLECAMFIARELEEKHEPWCIAHRALTNALMSKPDAFDRRKTGARFAMDWYYPVLSAALTQSAISDQLQAGWSKFVIPDQGCRCVADEPWVTVAETCELAIALVAAGQRDNAIELLDRILDIRDDDGVFWMGWQYEERLYWPKEKPSWTQAAVILAADAIYGTSRSSQLLTRSLL